MEKLSFKKSCRFDTLIDSVLTPKTLASTLQLIQRMQMHIWFPFEKMTSLTLILTILL